MLATLFSLLMYVLLLLFFVSFLFFQKFMYIFSLSLFGKVYTPKIAQWPRRFFFLLRFFDFYPTKKLGVLQYLHGCLLPRSHTHTCALFLILIFLFVLFYVFTEMADTFIWKIKKWFGVRICFGYTYFKSSVLTHIHTRFRKVKSFYLLFFGWNVIIIQTNFKKKLKSINCQHLFDGLCYCFIISFFSSSLFRKVIVFSISMKIEWGQERERERENWLNLQWKLI